MEAGKLDRKITIERATVTTGALGGETRTWATYATAWAEYTPVSDGERWRAGQMGATATARFVVRWSSALALVTEADRIVHDGRTFGIVGVKEIGRRVGIELTAGEQR